MGRSKTDFAATLRQKPLAIFGLGTSGKGVRALANKMGFDYTCFDEDEIEGARQLFTAGDAHQHAAVILSPGFPLAHPWVALARQNNLEILSELDFGALFLSKGVYAVTGTNGKTTLCEFIAHTLRQVGRATVTLGNNGQSLCAYLAENLEQEPSTFLIVEISSFQAEKLKFLELEGLLWTNFAENHLDYHETHQAYFEAKWRLLSLLKTPLFVCGQSVFEAAQEYQKELPDYTLCVSTSPNSPYDTLPEGTPFANWPFAEDFRLAATFGERVGLPRVIWHEAARTFNLPPHRFSLSSQINGVKFYNDAKSTTFASTLAALERFERPVLWIGGGKSKGGNLENFAKSLAPKLKEAYLIGQTAAAMSALLRRQGIPASVYANLEDAMDAAFNEAEKNDTIILSPGFSSLDQFENFAQRGNLFEKKVFELQQNAFNRTKA